MNLDKENIEQLFQSKFENFEADVNPKLWANIQSGIGQGAATGGSTSSSFLGSTLGKVATYTGAAILAAGSIYGVWKYNQTTEKQLQQITQEQIQAIESSKKTTPSAIIKAEEGKNNNVQEQPIKETTEKSTALELESINTPNPFPIINSNEEVEEQENNNASSQTANPPTKEDESDEEKSKDIADKLIEDAAIEPIASIYASPVSGYEPLEVDFSNYGYAASTEWEISDGNKMTGVSPTHTFTEPGIYTVTLTSTNKEGKTDTDEITIEVIKNGVEHGPASSIDFVPNVISPNNDGWNDTFIIESKNIQTSIFEVYSQNGKLVHKAENKINWAGENQYGSPVAEGNYYFIINAVGTDGKKYLEKGVLTVTR